MTITMQGSWTVAVKSKSAAFPQRFVIAGALSGNGSHPGDVSAPPVHVTGSHWTIRIQNNPGGGFVDSDAQLKFPTATPTEYRFDIESNDAGGDKDFNDLVLTCSTPKTVSDFIVYGNVRYYGPGCIVNPCRPRYLVIETALGLAEALRRPLFREALTALYPDRLKVAVPIIGPAPQPPPFTPIVIPLDGGHLIPPKQAQVVSFETVVLNRPPVKGRKAATADEPVHLVRSARAVDTAAPATSTAVYNRVALAALRDRYRFLCETGPLPGLVVRFQEYDRTASELAGGAYSGAGGRESLGTCATDANGNYIFRFSRSVGDFVDEALSDVGIGENAVMQSMPDLIAQVLDSAAPTGVCYETSPYWNVGLIRRIDICVPLSCIGRLPTACQGAHAIQAIGNIDIGEPDGAGNRVGHNNSLGAGGRVTSRNAGIGVPHTNCAAWAGVLDLFACFVDQPVTHYTIRWHRPGESSQFFQEEYRHHRIGSLDPNDDHVGPTDTLLHVDGGAAVSAKAYLNIESDNAWSFVHRDRKAFISTSLYAPPAAPGRIRFQIDGYNAAGFPVVSDSVWLFIDNSDPKFDIADVQMLGAPGGDCALYTVPATDPGAPLTVRFRATHGSMNAYGLGVRKGNIGSFPVSSPGPGQLTGAYVHGGDVVCNSFEGTSEDPTADMFDYVVADVVPTSGSWLTDEQPFCTFAVQLSCSTRVTNGYSAGNSYGPDEYLLGIQK